ncbi:MAG: hypothetical protein U9N54_00565 [candidate division Zixibacteria bacterium]|nr:hypothetical protein [candidate division Zixibacteria bacterium]
MKKIIVLIFGLILIIGCKEKINITSSYANNRMVIDGSGKDWNEAEFNYFNDDKVSVGISNDESHIYLLLLTKDLMLIKNIERRGLNIWIDEKGGTNKKTGIKILKNNDEFSPQKKQIRSQELSPEEREQLIQQIAKEKFTYVLSDSKKNWSVTKNNSINIAKDTERGFIFYEFQIPLTLTEPLKFDLKYDKKFSIGFELGEIDKDSLNKMKENRPENMDRQKGGRSGKGGMRGGGGKGMNQDNNYMKTLELWITSKLSSK